MKYTVVLVDQIKVLFGIVLNAPFILFIGNTQYILDAADKIFTVAGCGCANLISRI